MKKPFLLFALKATAILYFAACTSIDNYTTGKSAAPIVTKGVWKVDLFNDSQNDRTGDLAGYTFTFNSSGSLTATKDGVDTNGNWFEDDIANRITINLEATDPALSKINGHWSIRDISNATVEFRDDNAADEKLNITML